MISPAKALVAILILLGLLSPAAAEVLRLDYKGFAVWLDCERRGAVKFRYNAQRDQGNVERLSTFRLDANVPERCQQTSTDAYQHPDPKYHRGHRVPANHLDNSETAFVAVRVEVGGAGQHSGDDRDQSDDDGDQHGLSCLSERAPPCGEQ